MRTTRKNTAAFEARLRAELRGAVTRAAIMVQDEAVRLVSQQSSPPPSEPGEPPHLDTGTLARSIDWEVEDQPRSIVGRIGTNLDYGRYLELGTSIMAPRPYLRPALDRMRPHIQLMFRQAGRRASRQQGSGVRRGR